MVLGGGALVWGGQGRLPEGKTFELGPEGRGIAGRE